MNCDQGHDLLQRHLDGEASAEALEAHLRDCAACRASAPLVRRYVRGLRLLAPAEAPAGLRERITGQLVVEGRARRRARRRRALAWGGLAAAAAVLLAWGLWMNWPAGGPAPDPIANDQSPVEVEPRPEPLRDSMARVGGAVSGLTARAASDTADQTASLLSLVPAAGLEVPVGPPAPALRPIQEASEGVSTALAPMTQSARRAVGLFLRDLPVGRATEPEKKPG